MFCIKLLDSKGRVCFLTKMAGKVVVREMDDSWRKVVSFKTEIEAKIHLNKALNDLRFMSPKEYKWGMPKHWTTEQIEEYREGALERMSKAEVLPLE